MAPLFNENELLERVDGDLDFLAETVRMLETDGRSLVDDVNRALDAGDAPAVGRAAHALKGMVSNFCAPSTQQCASEVERLGKSADLAAARTAATSLERDLHALIAELQS